MMHEQKINVAIHITGGKPTKNLKVGRVDSFNHMKRKTIMKIRMSETLVAYRYEIFDTTSSYTQYKTNGTFFEIAEVIRSNGVMQPCLGKEEILFLIFH